MPVSLPFIPQTGDVLSPQYVHDFIDGAAPYDIGPDWFTGDERLVQESGATCATLPTMRLGDQLEFAGVSGYGFDSRSFVWTTPGKPAPGVIIPLQSLQYGTDGSGNTGLGNLWGFCSYQSGASLRFYDVDTANHVVHMYRDGFVWESRFGRPCVPGTDTNELNSPRDVAADASYAYVADTANHRIKVLKGRWQSEYPDWYYLQTSAVAGSGYSSLRLPSGVAVLQGRLFIADSGNDRVIVRWTPDVRRWCPGGFMGGYGRGPYLFNNPQAIEAHGEALYVGDTDNNRIVMYKVHFVASAVSMSYVRETAFSSPKHLFCSGDVLWCSDGAGALARLDPTTLSLTMVYPTCASLGDVRGMAMDSNGNLCFARQHQLARLSASLGVVPQGALVRVVGTERADFTNTTLPGAVLLKFQPLDCARHPAMVLTQTADTLGIYPLVAFGLTRVRTGPGPAGAWLQADSPVASVVSEPPDVNGIFVGGLLETATTEGLHKVHFWPSAMRRIA